VEKKLQDCCMFSDHVSFFSRKNKLAKVFLFDCFFSNQSFFSQVKTEPSHASVVRERFIVHCIFVGNGFPVEAVKN